MILRKIARRFAEDGHEVTVLSTQPSYKPEFANQTQPSVETVDGYKIVRSRMLGFRFIPRSLISFVNLILFFFTLVSHGIRYREYDLVMVSSSPPVLGGIAASFIARCSGAKLFYHCMDIHPEIGRLSGDFSNDVLFRLLRQLDIWTCKYAERVIVLSNDMKNAILSRPDSEQCNVEVIQNFNLNTDDTVSVELKREWLKHDGVFRLIFAGNIGRFQGLELLVETFLSIQDLNIELVILGEGKLKGVLAEIVAKSECDSVIFIPHQTIEVANEIIRTADVGLVSLSEGVYEYAYPTKIISYLSVACPLLVMIEPESDMVKFVETRQIGQCVTPGDSAALADAIRNMVDNESVMEDYKNNSIDVYGTFYDEEVVLDKWTNLVKSLLPSK